MNDQRAQESREHHFYVSIAKFLFHHPRYGIVAVRDPIRLADARQRELAPILLYGVTVAGLPIRWLTFSPVDEPKSLREVLLTAWGDAEGLRGTPDVLRVNGSLALSDPGLADYLAGIGIRLEIAGAKDKTVPASLRWAHDCSRWLSQRHKPIDLSLNACIEALCQDARDDHAWNARRTDDGLSKTKLEMRIEKWLNLPMRVPPSLPLEGGCWKAGTWLSSWEMSLPPDQPRYFHNDGFSGRSWLLKGPAPYDDADEDDYEMPASQERDNTPEIAKYLIACWPNPPKEVAATVGITLRQLQWFTSERTGLDETARDDLSRLLGIEYDERMQSYTPAGPYVLIARKAQAIQALYEEISGGGDACPCELVPAQGEADPSWRYVLINAYGTPPTIVMTPRGEAITEHLHRLMMNYHGIRPVSLALYRDVVATCARACLTPQANVREMREFASRYAQHWGHCAWLPD
ncbi:hypothetical protein [Segnochrobactrum spirostomi]|uniref:Uncharacterized protein n=1 Tax=Segnochrobactrum spirostomi TaxID=2608987 RepID=A0A6A7Y3H4_9HYPH|nr:hypothetical protein [Segnochrobactrum spirostomi]MQT12927.1 hypothetical protein [Segnochrobactrum spirostomi]